MEQERIRRIKQLRGRKNLWRKTTRVALTTFAWFGFAALYYVVMSLFFYTPYEYSLKVMTDRLHEQYGELQGRYDSLQMVLDNVEARDANIFNILFDASPNNFDFDHGQAVLNRYESLLNKSMAELRAEFDHRTDLLCDRGHEAILSTVDMVQQIDANSRYNGRIPAIQPIVNRGGALLTAGFGTKTNPFYKSTYHHKGVDYTVPEGTRVFATADGVVESIQLSSSNLGKSMVIDHGNGYKTAYNHMSRIYIPARRSVKRGEIIGLSGNTGLSSTPHLHYEVSFDGVAVDPTNYFFMEQSPAEYKRLIDIANTGMQSFD